MSASDVGIAIFVVFLLGVGFISLTFGVNVAIDEMDVTPEIQ